MAARLEFSTKVLAQAEVPVLKALGAEDVKLQARGYVIEVPEVNQAELDEVLALLVGERRTPAVIAMAVKAVTGRNAPIEGHPAPRKRRTAKDTAPAPETA